MKGLRASLIIESLKELSRLAKIEPDENEMTTVLTAILSVPSGDSSKVEGLMDRFLKLNISIFLKLTRLIRHVKQLHSSRRKISLQFLNSGKRAACSLDDCNLFWK
jgi:hypothetical protein